MTEYPEISLNQFRLIREIVERAQADPQYLEASGYPKDVKETISRWLAPKPNGAIQGPKTLEMDELEREAIQLFEELRDFGGSLTSDDVTEQMAYFRTRTSLLEKLIGVKERAAGVKQVNEFMAKVMGILDDVMTPDQRTEIIQRLK